MHVEKIDANRTGFYMTEQVSQRTLPANPVWRAREPNTFDDLGGEYTMVARRPFNPSRQRAKGTTVDLDVDGGFNEDLTQNNMQWPLQGFFFAALRQKPGQRSYSPEKDAVAFTAASGTDNATMVGHGLETGDGPYMVATTDTLPAPLAALTAYWVVVTAANTFRFATSKANALDGVFIDLTTNGVGTQSMSSLDAVDGTDDSFVFSDIATIQEGSLLFGKGHTNSANNGLHVVDSVDGVYALTNSTLVTEAPNGSSTVVVCGFQFPFSDVSLTTGGGVLTLESDTIDLTEFDLQPGEWTFLGGQADINRFATNDPGYARVKSVSETQIVFDKTTFTPTTTAGTYKQVQIFFGDFLKNESDEDLIKTYYYQQERTLGRDDNGRQAQYQVGAVANEMTWNSPLADKVNIDLGYIALEEDSRTGLEGPKSLDAGATRLAALKEDPFNTSKNVYQLRMNIIDPATLNPLPLFARITEWSATINNNVSPAKSQGTLGGFDVNVGGFDVGMACTAYFTTVAAIDAIRDNSDVTYHGIYSKRNAAVIIDFPLLGLGGGRLQVEQDQSIMVPLENSAAESPFGHTLSLTWLDYVPNVGVA